MGASGTGGSECSQRSIAAWTAAVTAPARIRGNMLADGFARSRTAIASASEYWVMACTLRYSPRSAGVLGDQPDPRHPVLVQRPVSGAVLRHHGRL